MLHRVPWKINSNVHERFEIQSYNWLKYFERFVAIAQLRRQNAINNEPEIGTL